MEKTMPLHCRPKMDDCYLTHKSFHPKTDDCHVQGQYMKLINLKKTLEMFSIASNNTQKYCFSKMPLFLFMSVINCNVTSQVAISPDGTQFITPDDHSDNYMLCLRVLRILWEQSGGRMTIVDLEQSLLHLYQVPCKHEMIENDLRNVVEVSCVHYQLGL